MLVNTLALDVPRAYLKNDAVKRRVSVAPRFGAWIKLLRKFADLDQDFLAKRAKIPVGQVRAMEHGDNVGIVYIQAVMNALLHVAAEGEDFVKLRRALDHEVFRSMAADARDQEILKRKAGTEPGERDGPTRKRRQAG